MGRGLGEIDEPDIACNLGIFVDDLVSEGGPGRVADVVMERIVVGEPLLSAVGAGHPPDVPGVPAPSRDRDLVSVRGPATDPVPALPRLVRQLVGLPAAGRNDGNVVVGATTELDRDVGAIGRPRGETRPLLVERQLLFSVASHGNRPDVHRTVSSRRERQGRRVGRERPQIGIGVELIDAPYAATRASEPRGPNLTGTQPDHRLETNEGYRDLRPRSAALGLLRSRPSTRCRMPPPGPSGETQSSDHPGKSGGSYFDR